MWFHVDHTTPAHSGRGCHLQVFRLKDEVHLVGHLDDLPTHQAQLLVVVQHSVHVLYPDGIHWAIKHDPFAVVICGCRVFPEGVGQDTVRPFVGYGIKGSVQLAHGD